MNIIAFLAEVIPHLFTIKISLHVFPVKVTVFFYCTEKCIWRLQCEFINSKAKVPDTYFHTELQWRWQKEYISWYKDHHFRGPSLHLCPSKFSSLIFTSERLNVTQLCPPSSYYNSQQNPFLNFIWAPEYCFRTEIKNVSRVICQNPPAG